MSSASMSKTVALKTLGIANSMAAIRKVKNQYIGMTRRMRFTKNAVGVSSGLEI